LPGKTNKVQLICILDNRNDDKGAAVNKKVIFGKYGFLDDTEYNIEFWVSE